MEKIRTPDVVEIDSSKIQSTTLGKSIHLALSDGTIALSTTMEDLIKSLDLGQWKDEVDTYANLPVSGNDVEDLRLVADTGTIYRWGGSSWSAIIQSGISNHSQLSAGTMNNDSRFVHLTAGERTILSKQTKRGSWGLMLIDEIAGLPSVSVSTAGEIRSGAKLVNEEATKYVRTKTWWGSALTAASTAGITLEVDSFREALVDVKPLDVVRDIATPSAGGTPFPIEETHLLKFDPAGLIFKMHRHNDPLSAQDLHLIAAHYEFEAQPALQDAALYNGTAGWLSSGNLSNIGFAATPQFEGSIGSLLLEFHNVSGALTAGRVSQGTTVNWTARLENDGTVREGCMGWSMIRTNLINGYGEFDVRLEKDASNYFKSVFALSSNWNLFQIRKFTKVGTLSAGDIGTVSFGVTGLETAGVLEAKVDGLIIYNR